MGNEVGLKTTKTVENYTRALKFLDECGDWTFDKLKEAHEIAGIDVSEYQLRSEWESASAILATEEKPGGTETLRNLLRKELKEAIPMLKTFARKHGAGGKKWWEFWK